jgi:CBS domain-containing protein
MTSKVISVSLNNTVEECLNLMTDRHLRHLPVLENEKLVGFISIGDLVKAAMDDQRVLIEQLQQYISGNLTRKKGQLIALFISQILDQAFKKF